MSARRTRGNENWLIRAKFNGAKSDRSATDVNSQQRNKLHINVFKFLNDICYSQYRRVSYISFLYIFCRSRIDIGPLWFSSEFPRSTTQATRYVPFVHIDPGEPWADIARRSENRRQKRQPVRSTSVMENIRGPWRGYPVRKILFRIASVCHCYVWRTDSSSAYPSCIMHPVIMQPLRGRGSRRRWRGEGKGWVRTPDSRIPFACFAISSHAPHDHPQRYRARAGARIYLLNT